MQKDFMFTSESVTEGHPDKLCDQISDAILDRFLQQDPYSGVIAECAVSTAIVFIAARFASHASVDVPNIARQVIDQVGYNHQAFNAKTCSIVTSLKELPPEERRSFDERELSEEEMDRIAVKNQSPSSVLPVTRHQRCSLCPSARPPAGQETRIRATAEDPAVLECGRQDSGRGGVSQSPGLPAFTALLSSVAKTSHLSRAGRR